jgi:uncharacterized protein YhaN
MEKTKSKAREFLRLDKLGQRIAKAARSFSKQRKERMLRTFERSLQPLS